MDTTTQGSETRDTLAGDLKFKNGEGLQQKIGQQMGNGYQAAMARLDSTLKTAKTGLINLEDTVVTRGKEAARSTDQYVHVHPWQAVGIGAFAGVLLGLLLGRK